MAVYLDASVLVALVAREQLSSIVTDWLKVGDRDIQVSDFALAEASSALARHRRMGVLTPAEAEDSFKRLDKWAADFAETTWVDSSDINTATRWVRRPDFALRAPDAIHVAAARRLDIVLVTLDHGMAAAARALGVACINPAETAA